MVEKCFECGTPCLSGETYCLKCQAEDGETVQLNLELTAQPGF